MHPEGTGKSQIAVCIHKEQPQPKNPLGLGDFCYVRALVYKENKISQILMYPPSSNYLVNFFFFYLLGKWDFTSLPNSCLVLNNSECCPPPPSKKTPLRKNPKKYTQREKFHSCDFGTLRTPMPFQEGKLPEN